MIRCWHSWRKSLTVNSDPGAKSEIVIVDDNPANLKLLREMLAIQGHQVRSFPLGRLAIAAVLKHPPDLILMDVNMPEMDGYETCARLKSNAAVADIPVIFLSALTETSDKVKAFHSGAADYITKPFQIEEVHSRVQTHLDLYHLQRALKRQNERLEELVAARTLELSEAYARLRILDESKTDFLTLISHEFRTPLNGLCGVSEIALEKLSGDPEGEKLERLYRRSRNRLLVILDDAILLGEIDVGTLRFNTTSVPLSLAIASALDQTQTIAQSRNVAIAFALPELQPSCGDSVAGDRVLVARAIQGLLETAVKFAQAGSSVQVLLEPSPDVLKIIIQTRGPSIPPAALARFFDTLAIGEALFPGGDLGLRPALTQKLLAIFGASAAVANRVDADGVQLTITFKPAP
jgi:two-component system sensor histidine kinase/response regulator